MGLEVTEKVFRFLEQRPQQGFTGREIAKWILVNYPKECQEKRDSSQANKFPLNSDSALLGQIVAEMKPEVMRRKHPQIKVTDDTPRKFYYSNRLLINPIFQPPHKEKEQPKPVPEKQVQSQVVESKAPDNKERKSLTEHELYPLLWKYLKSAYPKVYAKYIDEKSSKNTQGRNGNRWIHPDLVGVERAGENWGEEIRKCVNESPKLRLWSFEVKKEITRGYLREYFFQTVSNSTWANFGYLVASKIDNEKTMSELRILSNLHGIGFIRLDVDTPSESQILIPAKEREDVDWDTADRLAKENGDFKGYIENIGVFYAKDYWNKEYWSRLKEPR